MGNVTFEYQNTKLISNSRFNRIRVLYKTILILLLTVFVSTSSVFAGELLVSKAFHDVAIQADFGNAESRNVMQILKSHAEVATEFGGGYLSAILKQGEWKESDHSHWFYYVNGVLASVGALLFYPKSGDHIWWDLHSWDGERYLSAVIGAWPEPFLSGAGGSESVPSTNIWAAAGFQEEGARLGELLKKKRVRDVMISALEQNSKVNFERNFSICIGPWQSLQQNQKLDDLFKHGAKVGLFVQHKNHQLIALDWKGKETKMYEKAGCIIALKSAFESFHPVWIVSGTDEASVSQAFTVLVDHPEKIRNRPGVIVTEKEVANVPLFT